MPAQNTATVKKTHSPSSYDPVAALLGGQPIFGEVSINPASIAAGAIGATAVDISALMPAGCIATTGHNVSVYPPATLEAGLVPVGAHITAANQLTVRLLNTSAAPIDGAARTWTFRVERAPRFSYV